MKKQLIIMTSIMVLAGSLLSCNKSPVKVSASKPVASQTETKATEIPKEFEEVAGMLKNITGLEIPYWGGYNLNDQQIIIFSEAHDKAILWHGKDGSIQVINKSNIPEEKRLSSFADGEFNGTKTTFVMQEEDGKQAFILAVHEGYHFYGQAWLNQVASNNDIPRGTLYPENIQARNLMNQADKKLRDHMEGQNNDGHKEALHIINLMRSSNLEDLQGNLSTGHAEGSANFIENIYLAAALKPQLKNDMTKLVAEAYQLNKANIHGGFHDKGMEYYQVASLPLYYLGMNNHHQVIDQLKEGKHALELLGEVTQAKAVELDPELTKSVKDYYVGNNQEAGKSIEKFKKQMASDDYIKVMVADHLFPGSMGFGEFINFKVGDIYKTLNTQTSAVVNVSKGQAELIGQDTMNTDDYKYYVFYVKKSDLQKGASLNISTDTLKFKDVAYEIKDNVIIISK